MAHIAIIGAGTTGLGAALFLARRGYTVDLFEQDGLDAGAEPAAAWAMPRRGVPQTRQSHIFRSLSSQVLAQEAPDLLRELRAAAFEHHPLAALGEDSVYSLLARRSTYEALFRGVVARESGVSFHHARVAGLLAAPAGRAVPHVVGLRLDDGTEVRADLVADASGRWTAAADWLAAIGAGPWRERLHETPIFYLTRWYALQAGAALPKLAWPAITPLPYLFAVAFAGDGGTFSIALAPSMDDPCRGRLRDPEVFNRIVAALPVAAPLLDVGDPLTEPLALARINNCHRSLSDGGRLLVTGFVLLGDAADHTNPTLGRGVSLGLLQAQELARTADQALADPVAHAAAFERWSADNVGVWFESQVANDTGYLAGVAAAIRGEDPPPPSAHARLQRATLALAADDTQVAVAMTREAHMLAPPGSTLADPALGARIRAAADRGAAPRPPPGPSRAQFEAIVAG